MVAQLSVARIADALAVSWNAANRAVLAEGRRLLIDDSARFDDHVERVRHGDRVAEFVGGGGIFAGEAVHRDDLGFRNVTNYIARSLLETKGFRRQLHPSIGYEPVDVSLWSEGGARTKVERPRA